MPLRRTDLNPRIIESLYCEALVLADEIRFVLDRDPETEDAGAESLARMAFSCEALRTSTRMMHAIGWLLNQRAFIKGELSEAQLRRHSRLPYDKARSDPDNLMLLPPETRALVIDSERFYARIERLDAAWREGHDRTPPPVRALRQRLGEVLGQF